VLVEPGSHFVWFIRMAWETRYERFFRLSSVLSVSGLVSMEFMGSMSAGACRRIVLVLLQIIMDFGVTLIDCELL
jgi:hypothetical protein